jgi:hypothetical protein
VRNRGFVLVRQFLTILSRLNSRMDCHPTDKVRFRGFGVLRAQLRRPVAGGQSVPFGYFFYSMWSARHKAAVRDRQKRGREDSLVVAAGATRSARPNPASAIHKRSAVKLPFRGLRDCGSLQKEWIDGTE